MNPLGKPNPHQTTNPTPAGESETRKGVLRFAEKAGGAEAVQEVKLLFEKWDNIMKLAPEDERQQMAEMAILEVESLLSIHSELRDGLSIDGKVVIPGTPGWRDK